MDRIDALTKKLFKMKSMVQTVGVGTGTHADQMVDNELRERFKVSESESVPLRTHTRSRAQKCRDPCTHPHALSHAASPRFTIHDS